MSAVRIFVHQPMTFAGILPMLLLAVLPASDAFSQQRTTSPRRAATTNPGREVASATNRSRGPFVVSAPFGGMLVSPESYVSPFASLFASNARPSTAEERRAYYESANRTRLLDVPEMFGDFRRAGPSIVIAPTTGARAGLLTEFPIAAAISGLRAAENNRALPSNRVWVAYNYFNSAFDVATDDSFGLSPQNDGRSLHRSIVAVETLLDEGQTSVEVRMPFGSAFDSNGIAGPVTSPAPYSVSSASIGNLNVLLKRLLYADENWAWSAGLGLEVPTGSEGVIRYDDIAAVLDPKAVHFVPFAAITRRAERWFGNGFMQLDFPSHGDRLNATLNSIGVFETAGRIDQPPLFGMDIGGGYWLVTPSDRGAGLAVVVEVHYTTPLAPSDGFGASGGLTDVSVNSSAGPEYDLLHFTAGLQLAMANGWQIRPAVVVPAKDERVFDAEFLLQVNRQL